MALGKGLGGRESRADSHDKGHMQSLSSPRLGRPRNWEKKPQELDSLDRWVNGFLMLSPPLRAILSALSLRFQNTGSPDPGCLGHRTSQLETNTVVVLRC